MIWGTSQFILSYFRHLIKYGRKGLVRMNAFRQNTNSKFHTVYYDVVLAPERFILVYSNVHYLDANVEKRELYLLNVMPQLSSQNHSD